MNKFISLLGTLTLFAKKEKSEDISDEDIEPEEEKPAPDVVSKSTRKNVSRNATFVRPKPSPLPPGSKYPYIEEVAPTNDEVEVFDEEPELPQNQSNKSSLGEMTFVIFSIYRRILAISSCYRHVVLSCPRIFYHHSSFICHSSPLPVISTPPLTFYSFLYSSHISFQIPLRIIIIIQSYNLFIQLYQLQLLTSSFTTFCILDIL